MVCAISGLALGADLAFPTLLLTRLIAAQTANQIAIHNQQQAGYWFGRWNQYAKLALALAAGVCLPALNWAGYQPQQHNTSFTLGLLVGLYAALPCLIKLIVLRQLNRHTLLWSHFNAT
jgi:Na+/melibiose symporter-like transporter